MENQFKPILSIFSLKLTFEMFCHQFKLVCFLFTSFHFLSLILVILENSLLCLSQSVITWEQKLELNRIIHLLAYFSKNESKTLLSVSLLIDVILDSKLQRTSPTVWCFIFIQYLLESEAFFLLLLFLQPVEAFASCCALKLEELKFVKWEIYSGIT